MSPKIVDKTEKKRTILQAAMKVFARKGFAKAKMNDIALEAGIGKGTIYEYFRSKDQIFINAFHFFIGDMEAEFNKILARDMNPKEKLVAIIKATFDSFFSAGDFGGILMDFWAEGIRNHQQEAMEDVFNLKEVYRKYRQIIMDILEEGIRCGMFREIDTQTTASLLFGCLDGIMLQYILDPAFVDMNAASRTLADIFTTSLTKHKSR